MRVTVFGAGYVGLVSAVCLAELGYKICCCDIDEKKVELLQQGKSPIYEKDLPELLKKNLQNGQLKFTHSIAEAVNFASIKMIAVGTPSASDGSIDLSQVIAVADEIAEHLQEDSIIIVKSTVSVGTNLLLQTRMRKILLRRQINITVDVVSNPEFLREGSAIYDFFYPDRIVVGSDSSVAIQQLKILYAPLLAQGTPWLVMTAHSAELSKYAANAFLATKISFMNELSQLAEVLDVDIEQVKSVMGLDARIGKQFLNAGCGFGGSCFPKDLQALMMQASRCQSPLSIIEAVWRVNEKQKNILFRKIFYYFGGNLQGKVIALWGLAFKPNTDDVRCAPSRDLIERLQHAGAIIQAYDPLAVSTIRRLYDESASLVLCPSAQAAITGADVLAIVTEWEEFRHPDFDALKKNLSHPAIFDGRNLYDPLTLQSLGFEYFATGRGKASWPKQPISSREKITQ